MFTQSFEDIISFAALKAAFEKIDTRSSGIDDVSLGIFEEKLLTNLQTLQDELISGGYTPQPLEKIEISKPNSNEKRPIALGTIRDKIVQHVLLDALTPYFETIFSDKSYAYRPQRSHVRAIARTKDFIMRGFLWVIRADIDNFFETINHSRLLNILDRHIKDPLLLNVIDLFIRNGLFEKHDYRSHTKGVHQGDILSPLLSNIYLHQMDAFFERKGIEFVRFADDFIVMCGSKEHSETTLKELRIFLRTIDLSLEDSKTLITSVAQGFGFLGAYFKGDEVMVDPARFEKTREKIRSFVFEKYPFKDFVIRISAYVKTLRLMYASFVSSQSLQMRELDDDIWEAVSARIYLAKESGEVGSKSAFKELLAPLTLFHVISQEEHKRRLELAIVRGYEKYHEEHPTSQKGRTDPLQRKKIEYAHAFARLSTLHVTTPGVFIGMAKNRYTIKEHGKVLQSIPKSQIERIIINARGVTLSSSLIESCSKAKVPIDFIDHTHTPYASIVTNHAPLPQTAIRQYEIYFSGEGLYLAKEFIEGKAKNQINYLKYLDRYHEKLDPIITKMEYQLKEMKKKGSTTAEVMGYEGSISALYWSGIAAVLDTSWGFTARVTKGASDTVNSALNYAYAILYGKIQEALVRSGLSLYVSYLHVPDQHKPTLVFDMIEEFRAFVVDRTIVTMLNRDEPIRVDSSGKLTQLARQKIAENVFERLGSYTTWKKESRKITTIIQYQAYLLSRHIHGEEKYAAFIGKY